MPYLIILIVVLIVSPLVLKLAQSQKKEVKIKLKLILLILLITQIILGFFNFETFTNGRSGINLSLIYPGSFLGLFFVISVTQIILLLNKSFNTLVVVLNFINSVLFFVAMIRLSSLLGFQPVSLASSGTVFLVLTGNIVSLAYINKDKNLLSKYFK